MLVRMTGDGSGLDYGQEVSTSDDVVLNCPTGKFGQKTSQMTTSWRNALEQKP